MSFSLPEQGKHAEATEIQREVLVSTTCLHVTEHEGTLISASNLAQGREIQIRSNSTGFEIWIRWIYWAFISDTGFLVATSMCLRIWWEVWGVASWHGRAHGNCASGDSASDSARFPRNQIS